MCGCVQSAPDRTDDELFIWQGPDDKTLLFKWYNLLGSNQDWGGYSEARANLSNPCSDRRRDHPHPEPDAGDLRPPASSAPAGTT